MVPQVPKWVVFSKDSWKAITPLEAGLDVGKWSRFLETCNVRGATEPAGESEPLLWGAVLTKGGYVLHTWGSPEFWGRTASVFESKDWYPSAPGYGDFVDPPYEIGGHAVRGGPGWVVINALDLARFGHLVATGGMWDGKRLASPEWLRGHHGGDSNQVGGESTHFTAMSRVSTLGIEHPLPEELFASPVLPVR